MKHQGITVVAVFSLAACGPQPRPAAAPPAAAHALNVTGAATALSRLTSDPLDERYPAVSPDGHTLLFTAGTFREIFTPVATTLVGIDPNNPGARTVFTSNNSQVGNAAWLPDGTSFVYNTNSAGTWSIMRALTTTPGAGVTVVVSGSSAPVPSDPNVSPDGTRVAFQTQLTSGTWSIGVANLDGSHVTFLGEGFSPRWSPDGSRLAFGRTINGSNQLFLIDPTNGTNVTQLTSEAAHSHNASWSPDGRFLVFSSNRGTHADAYNLFVIRRDGTGLGQLTDTTGVAWFPMWGRDGWIYFSYYDAATGTSNDIWRLRPGGELAGVPANAPTAHP